MKDIVIIGAGMAGYGAATKLYDEGLDFSLYEKNSYYGGHCASFKFEGGWIFDDGPHISFTKNENIKKLFAENVNGQYIKLKARVNNYWQGSWVKHPAQVNLHGLPPELNTEILHEMMAISQNGEANISNYKDWLHASYGETFAENFPMKYTRKYHTTDASNLTTDWLGARLYRPKLKEVIYGMLSPDTEDVHYVSDFRYPTNGGYVSFMRGLEKLGSINYHHHATGISLRDKELIFNGNKSKKYDYVISSMPLKVLVSLIERVPEDVKVAADLLACTQCVLVNLGINRENINPQDWTYFYDEDFNIVRLSSPSNFSKNNVPEGCSSIQAEIYFSAKYKPLKKEPHQYIDIVIDELIRSSVLKESDKIVYQSAWLIPFAQIIYDHDRADSVRLIQDFLQENNILSCGRYGEWSYAWSDESFLGGISAASQIIEEYDKV